MKLILSRKGFDSKYGGCASPIFEDESMVSLPIPFPDSPRKMHEATARNSNFADCDVLSDLTRRRQPSRRVNSHTSVHLDPDLYRPEGAKSRFWRPAFGQDGTAQGHLRNEGVGPGDLFLFFGWFRRVRKLPDCPYEYLREGPDIHSLFGWLQVDEVISISASMSIKAQRWLALHPHWQEIEKMGTQNTAYVATKELRLDGKAVGVAGGGVFKHFKPCLQLTAPGAKGRSNWQLPAWFHPSADETPTLSHHRRKSVADSPSDRDRWQGGSEDDSKARLRVVDLGQEFVIDLSGSREAKALDWIRSLFAEPVRT